MPDLSEYKKDLRELAEAGSTQFINNSSIDHAAAMIEELFKNAQGKAFIFSGYLEPRVYDRHELRQAAAEFLKKSGNELDIIMQSDDPAEINSISTNNFISLLREFAPKVRLYNANTKKLKDLKNHFMVVKTITGNYALRFEIDTKEHIATGTFNGGKSGEDLYDFFNSSLLDGSAKEIPAAN